MYECIYEDEIIRLRKATMDDAPFLHELIKDQKVMAFYGESETTYEGAKSDIKWFNDLFDMNAGRWVIEDRLSGNYIGDVGVFGYHKKHKKGEIGFKLDSKFWNKGIMSKCVQAVLSVAFMDWGYNRVEALVDVRNTGCQRLLQKSRFVKEGTLRDYEFEHGHYVDLEMHAILHRDFIEL
ncbi:GNAT family N-acetyltransferase [Acidaminobacter sp. JC074]|uniref:GNAT family N-acetyltransferase n=1 Tax=Acidaminobacter sp. JC074 TaxID=2530199 RepID=UPI001F0FB411|nr:GNAT family protein [Acidaminobacter sp. JC074]MCH4886210.1 GNAT family N-acetyltransferase [Acidaminobacter sp. JC074]